MSNIILKRSSVAGKVPLATDLSAGELALNTNDGMIYTKRDSGEVVSVGRYFVNQALGSVSGTRAIDLGAGNSVSATITGATTFSFTDPAPSGKMCGLVLQLTNGGVAAITWPTSVKWSADAAPTLTSAGLDILVFTTIDGGASWHGQVVSLDSK